MRTKIIIIVVSVLVGVLVMLGVGRYLASEKAQITQDATYVSVVVANQAIPAGTTVEAAQGAGLLGTKRVPGRYLAANVVRSIGDISGQVAADPIAAGEQVTTTRFQNPSALGLSISVPAGYLAVSLPYDTARGVTDLVKVGDSVAVLGTFDTAAAGTEPVTTIIVARADVLAVGTTTNDVATNVVTEEAKASSTQKTITLALSSADVERVVYSQEIGRIWFALYGKSDTASVVSTRATLPSVVR